MASGTHWQLLSSSLRPHVRVLAALGVVLAVASTLPLAGPQLLRAFVDEASAGAALPLLVTIAGGYMSLGLATQAATVGTAFLATRVAWTATNTLRERVARHLLSLDLSFHGSTSPGTLVERADGDATAITRFFSDVVVKSASAAITAVGAVVLVSIEDWRAGLGLLVLGILAFVVIARLRDRAVPATTAERAAYANVIGLVEEQLEGAEDLRALGAGSYALERHAARSAEHLRAIVRGEHETTKVWVALLGFFALGGAAMLLGGWWLHRTGAISLGTVLLLFMYTQVLRRPVEVLAEQLQEVQRAGAGASRIRALLDERPAIRDDGTASLPEGPLSVQFQRVGFTYPDEAVDAGRRVLHGIDLDIAAGETIGLVGRTGSGKTTMARLALRLVDPTEGAVLLGGNDLRAIAGSELRRHVAVVTQDVQILTTTLRENLTVFGTVEADDETLRDLLHELGLDDWLAALPDGLDTVLDHAAGMSAGQAQLLGLARAFLRDPGLVVLDEASSRTDPATSERVEAALDRLLAGRTTIVIAHRLQAVARADRIVVLDHGRIVESGPRSALAADPASLFARLLAMERTATTGTTGRTSTSSDTTGDGVPVDLGPARPATEPTAEEHR